MREMSEARGIMQEITKKSLPPPLLIYTYTTTSPTIPIVYGSVNTHSPTPNPLFPVFFSDVFLSFFQKGRKQPRKQTQIYYYANCSRDIIS